MTSRPILFSAAMVRALLAGTKTQTRRIAELNTEGDPSPKYRLDPDGFVRTYIGDVTEQPETDPEAWMMVQDGWERGYRCPYGVPGDRLWVRETWAPMPAGVLSDGLTGRYIYRADPDVFSHTSESDFEKWRPSIHMPRAASRITLEITGVRVERLQGISGRDVLAEGIDNGKSNPAMGERWENMQRMAFRDLWESINGPGSWDAKPWVWVVQFKRVEN